VASFGVFVIGLVVNREVAKRRLSTLFYELNEAERQKFGIIEQPITHLARTHQVWRVEGDTPTSDWKRHAGASSLVRRVGCSIGYSSPPQVKSNMKIPSMTLGNATLYFMPDLILYREGKAFGAIAYGDCQVEQGSTRFIEDGYVPPDAAVVGRTWRYIKKDGGPDLRFSNNAELSVVQYGTLAFRSSRGLNIHLQTSSLDASVSFALCWKEVQHRIGNHAGQVVSEDNRAATYGPDADARRILGVSGTASFDAISAAYRHMAQMYHPDKVAGLAPEFQSLADTRMKEINAAYELLKRRHSSIA
jgi:hypothetical protein